MRKLPVAPEPSEADENDKPTTTTGETDVATILERMGVDDFLLEYRDEAIPDLLRGFVEQLLTYVSNRGGKTVEFAATQHSRNYGFDTRVKVVVVLQIPRQISTTVVKSRSKNTRRALLESIDNEVDSTNEPIPEL